MVVGSKAQQSTAAGTNNKRKASGDGLQGVYFKKVKVQPKLKLADATAIRDRRSTDGFVEGEATLKISDLPESFTRDRCPNFLKFDKKTGPCYRDVECKENGSWFCRGGHGPFEAVPTLWNLDDMPVADENDGGKPYRVSVRHNGVQQLLPEGHTLPKHFEALEKLTEVIRNSYKDMLLGKTFTCTVRVGRSGDDHSFTVTPRTRVIAS